MPIPINKKLYEDAKKKIMASYKKPSAFAHGAVVKEYKRLGGKYKDDGKPRHLKRWFEEEWVDINPLINVRNKDAYPVFRPTKYVNKHTPTLFQDIPADKLKKQFILKQKIKGDSRLPKFGEGIEEGEEGEEEDLYISEDISPNVDEELNIQNLPIDNPFHPTKPIVYLTEKELKKQQRELAKKNPFNKKKGSGLKEELISHFKEDEGELMEMAKALKKHKKKEEMIDKYAKKIGGMIVKKDPFNDYS